MVIDILLASLLSMLAITGWLANVLGMPGNWLVVLLAAGCLGLAPPESLVHVTWGPLVVIILSSVLGEVLEFVAGALGASRKGGSKRGTVLALGGSVIGAITGLFFGSAIPIPLIGPLLASLLLGASGAFAGAIAGERWAGKDWDASIQIGNAAFWGRLLGTVGKAVCGTIACGVFLVALWV
jgi:uncharacterized protein YqgC (DUF456 family)